MHWNQSYEKRLDLLVEQGEVLAGQVAKNDYLFQQLQPEVTARIQSVADLVGGRVALVNNSLVVVKDTSGREEGKTLISEEPILAMRGETRTYYSDAEEMVEVVMPVVIGVTDDNPGQVIGAIILEVSLADVSAEQTAIQKSSLLQTI